MSNYDDAAAVLLRDGVVVLRTDTIYGVVARAADERAVQRVYDIKGRTPTKSPIVLIDSYADMFDAYNAQTHEILDRYWPGPVSIIVPATNAPDWITRGNASVAYRMPAQDKLRKLIQKTGPLIAPSANPEGQSPAMNITEAQNYFGEKIDTYIDGGEVTNPKPSTLYLLSGDTLEQLR